MDKVKVTLLYDAIEDQVKAEAEARGKRFPLVYEQVASAISKRGHTVNLFPIKQVKTLSSQIDKDDSDLIFNLVESINGVSGKDQQLAGLLELLEKPFTGSGSMGLTLSTDKALSKKIFQFHGVPYPKFTCIDAGQVEWSDHLHFPLFVKPVDEDASIGISNNAVVNNVKELMERISYIHTEIHTAALIEEFIEGREIYVSVIGNEKPQALPILEWDFSRVPEGHPRIASAEAKWDDDAEAYKDTPEIFPTDIPEPVYQKIQQVAIDAFKALRLRDYARFDMRLRQNKRPVVKGVKTDPLDEWEFFVIEANPNPWLERNSEFVRSARKAGLSHPDTLERIMEGAIKRHRSRKVRPPA